MSACSRTAGSVRLGKRIQRVYAIDKSGQSVVEQTFLYSCSARRARNHDLHYRSVRSVSMHEACKRGLVLPFATGGAKHLPTLQSHRTRS